MSPEIYPGIYKPSDEQISPVSIVTKGIKYFEGQGPDEVYLRLRRKLEPHVPRNYKDLTERQVRTIAGRAIKPLVYLTQSKMQSTRHYERALSWGIEITPEEGFTFVDPAFTIRQADIKSFDTSIGRIPHETLAEYLRSNYLIGDA